MTLSLIAAVARDGVVGGNNQLLWRLPEDMAFFKRTTTGHPVIMGRKTWESIPPRFRPLPERANIVVTRQAGWQADGAQVAHSLSQALALAATHPSPSGRVFVIGGAELWALALPQADELLLTEIDHGFAGDTHFPPWPRADFFEAAREHHRAAPPNDFSFDFVTYLRRP